MRTRLLGAAVALLATAACGGLTTGCGGSNSSSAAAHDTTTAAQSTPATITVPVTTAAADPVTPVPVRAGSVAAGKAVFTTHCDTCHAGLGTRRYIGPKLTGQGLSASFIRNRVIQGKSPMPAGLVSGQDLADVVAFVHSIQ